MTKGARIRAVGLALLLLSGAVLRPSDAFADPTSAELHFTRGQKAMSDGDPALAASEFRAAWRAEPSARTLLAIATAYDRAGDAPAAVAYYWWYLNSGAATAAEQEWLFPRILQLTEPPARAAEKPAGPALDARVAPAEPAHESVPDPAAPKVSLATPSPAPTPPRQPEPTPPASSKRMPTRKRLVAAADPNPEPELPPRRDTPEASLTTRSRWYGMPMLVGEGLSFVVLVGGAANDSEGAVVLGTLGVVLTSPIVHSYHGHGMRAFGGLLMRAGGAGLGGLAGGKSGAVGGYLAAFALDLLIASDDVPVEPAPRFAPTLGLIPGGASVGVVGSF